MLGSKKQHWNQVNRKIDTANVLNVSEPPKSISSPQNERHPIIMNLLKIDVWNFQIIFDCLRLVKI